ncbi:MAG: WbqC family protein [Magnetococcus sp. DMHC-1]|nr:WbqC family protein [Magnetococcales bacterium]
MTTLAIMQPTYLPWAGYFGLMDQVDQFVLLDSVQYDRRSWQQRNRIKTADGAQWLTVPVLSKGLREQRIQDVAIDTGRDFIVTHARSLRTAYGKTPYFQDYVPGLIDILEKGHARLAALTMELIQWLRDRLGITTPLLYASTLETTGSKAELLAGICTHLGATRYVSPPGSKEYLDNSTAFADRGIPVGYFAFEHPQYAQPFGEFIPYMSVVDLLCNCGPESLELIRKGCKIS